MFDFGETLTLLTRTKTGEDSDGNDVYDYVSASTLDAWAVSPRNSSELVQGQDTVVVGVNAVRMGIVAVAAIDRVHIDTGAYTGTYDVDGLPGFYDNPMTGTQVTELHLTKVTG